MSRRALVTGAAGFLGANLVRELLRREAEVHALVRPDGNLWRLQEIRPQLRLHSVDITDRQSVVRIVGEVRPELVFHLAARRGHPFTSPEREASLKTGVLGTSNLLEALAGVEFRRLVHFGSSLEYGPRREPLCESDALQPSTFRGAVKAAETILCQQFSLAHGLPVVILRIFSMFGYWEAGRLIPTAMRAAFRGEELPLTAPGFRHDYLFVEDLVEACLLAAEASNVGGEIINIGSGRQWTNEEMVTLLQEVSGRPVLARPGAYPPHAPDTTHWVADIRKAERLLGWRPRHTLRSGLEKTWAWFCEAEAGLGHGDTETRRRNKMGRRGF